MRTRAWTASAVRVHLVLVAVISAAFALVSYGAEEPNIGAGGLVLLLVGLGFPWSILVLVTSHVVSDLALIAAGTANVVLHQAAVAALSRRRPAVVAPQESAHEAPRLAAGTLALGLALLCVGVVVGTALQSRRSQTALQAQVTGLVPPDTWAAGTLELPGRCTFCHPQSSTAKATRLVLRDRSEAVLLEAVDQRSQGRRYTPDDAWSCHASDDAGQAADGEQRVCFRSFTGTGFSAFTRVYFYADRDPQLWLDVTRGSPAG